MPKIVQTSKQEQALKQVTEGLEELGKIQEIREYAEHNNLTVVCGQGRKKAASIESNASATSKISKALAIQAKEIAREIGKLSRLYRIELDDDESDLVANALTETISSGDDAADDESDEGEQLTMAETQSDAVEDDDNDMLDINGNEYPNLT